MPNILESDSDSSDGEEGQLVINKKFARRFEDAERKKELARSKELLLDEDEDSSESDTEDEDAELLSPGLDVQIVKTINSIRKKDPKIYDKTTTWFAKGQEPANDNDSDNDHQTSSKSAKKQRFKDVLRNQLLADGADIDGEDRGDDLKSDRRALAYDAEQERIRRELISAVKVGDSSDDDGSNNSDDEMLKVRVKDAAELAKEEAELKEALVEMVNLGKKGKKEVDEKDAFLLDYISQKKWKGEKLKVTEDSSSGEDNDDEGDDGDVDLDEDEELLDKTDAFESKYNFRFEELQGKNEDNEDGILTGIRGSGLSAIQVTGHARNVEGSLRRKDDKRKQQRESRKERKEKERRQKEAELRRLKNLKKQELQERLRKISEVGGLKDMGLDEAVLDEDWDPEKYEAMMQKQFGDGYYDEDDDGDFDASKVLDGLDDIDEGEYMDDEENEEGYHDQQQQQEEEEEEEGDTGKKKKKRGKDKKKDKKAKKDADEAGDDDDADETTAAGGAAMSSMMDELYKLDYEDIVAGIPCRFKYRQVKPESFGLSAEEILQADDNDLNSFVSLKKLSAYVPSENLDEYKVSKKRKRLRAALRERLEKEEKEEQTAADKKTTKKKKSSSGGEEEVGDADAEETEQVDANESEAAAADAAAVSGKKKRRRRKKKSGNGNDDENHEGGDSDEEDEGEPQAAGGEESKPKSSGSKKAPAVELVNVKDQGEVPAFVQRAEKNREKEKKKEKKDKKNKKKESTPEEIAAEAKKRRLNLYD